MNTQQNPFNPNPPARKSYLDEEEKKAKSFITDIDYMKLVSGCEIKILPQPKSENPFFSLYYWNDFQLKIFVQAYEMNWGSDTFKDPLQFVCNKLKDFGYKTIQPKLLVYFNVLDLSDNKIKVLRVSRNTYQSILNKQRLREKFNRPYLEDDNSVTLVFMEKRVNQNVTTFECEIGRDYQIAPNMYRDKILQLSERFKVIYTPDKVKQIILSAFQYANYVIQNTPSNAGNHVPILLEEIKEGLKRIQEHNLKFAQEATNTQQIGGNQMQGLPSNQVPSSYAPNTDISTMDEDPFGDNIQNYTQVQPQTQFVHSQQNFTQASQTGIQIPKVETVNPQTISNQIPTENTANSQYTNVNPQQQANPQTISNKVKLPGSPDCYGTKIPMSGLDCNKCAYKLLCYS
jgi:hypothetical protein